MRQPPMQFLSICDGPKKCPAWRHVLLSSMWCVPNLLRSVAVKPFYPFTMLNLASNTRSRNDRGERNGKIHLDVHPLTQDVKVHRTFLRKGHTSSSSPSSFSSSSSTTVTTTKESRPSTCGSNEETNMLQGNSAEVTERFKNCALGAFQQWSQRTGSCKANEFIQGVQQSYYSLGVLLSTLAEAARPRVPNGKILPLSKALTQLKEMLVKEYEINVASLSWEFTAAEPKTEPEKRTIAKTVAHALMQVLPLSPNGAETLYYLWDKQRMLEANLFCFAAPTDFILSTEVILFHECNKVDEVHFADNAPFSVITMQSSPTKKQDSTSGGGADATVSASVTEAEDKTDSTIRKGNPLQYEKERSSVAFNGKKVENVQPKGGQTVITYKGQSLPLIPAEALACVVVAIDVVTPPQRYVPAFDWFYQRISGHESEYERIAAARIFAMSNARPFVAPLDFLMRTFTGRPLEFMCTSSLSEMIGIPKNIQDCPPATRKLLCFYMDANERWVLSSLVAVGNVMTTTVPKTSAA